MFDRAKSAGTAVQSETQSFKSNVQGLGDDLGHVKDDIVGLGHDVAHTARSGVAAARAGASHAVDAVRERGDEAVEALKHQVSSRPLVSLGVALGAGVVLGMLLFRPRS